VNAAESTAIDAPPIGGDIPSPLQPPAGCHFHPRCPLATAVCRERYPEPRSVSDEHVVSCHLL
jgi:peptide/nickel transport system ATP-binding protein